MNSIDYRSGPTEGSQYDGAPKAQLHCPVCGHESPADGDWIDVRPESDEDAPRLVTCPKCGTTITERPALSTKFGAVVSPAD